MTTVLTCVLIIAVGLIVYQFLRFKKRISELRIEIDELKKQQIPDKDIQYLEFTVDMYIKYAKDLDIHSKEQHEYIVNELERIRDKYLTNEK